MDLINKVKNFGIKSGLAASIILLYNCVNPKYPEYHVNEKVLGNQTEFYETFWGKIGMKVQDINGTTFDYNIKTDLSTDSLIVSNFKNKKSFVKKYTHETVAGEKMLMLAEKRKNDILKEIKKIKGL